jgi:hypothetical protein
MTDKNPGTPNSVRRTERGKEERLETEEVMDGTPVEPPRPQEPAQITRDRGVKPADEARHGSRGEANRKADE